MQPHSLFQQKSQVAALLAQIDAEYASARQGLHGLAEGTARHEIITARMERAQQVSEKLIEVIGREQALPLIISVMEGSTTPRQSS